jgi:hypothetical protein
MALRSGTAENGSLMKRERSLRDLHADPMEAMGNLLDITFLLAVGFLVVALSGFGLNEMLSQEDLTIVKNPGTMNMEIITRQNGKIRKLKATDAEVTGVGTPVGTVYQLQDGRMIWVPGPQNGETTTTP